ncbi:MAG: flagellar brake protein [Proteobacteria bacterium]|nr:flagellar brake protein [Pseudomonadota bacterium]
MSDQDLKIEERQGQRLHLELGTPMMLSLEGMDAQVRSVFVGMEVDKYFILSLPRISEFQDLLYPGNLAVLRFISAGKICAFETEILGLFYKKPVRALYLAYPPKVEIVNLRQVPRVDSYLPARTVCRENEVKGAILDISACGIRFGSTQCNEEELSAIKVDDPVVVSCQFPGLAEVQTLQCIVRNIRIGESMITLGLAFSDVSPDLFSAIDDYIKQVSEFLPDD